VLLIIKYIIRNITAIAAERADGYFSGPASAILYGMNVHTLGLTQHRASSRKERTNQLMKKYIYLYI
jgi:hypothetical protein